MKIAPRLESGGARFTCLVPEGCNGHCCSGGGSIYIFPIDIPRFLDFFDTTLDEFLDEHVDIDKIPPEHVDATKIDLVPVMIVKEKQDGSCEFLDERGLCKAYPARPFQCRGYPFWNQNTASNKRWNRLLEYCEGAKRAFDCKEGRKFTVRQIRALVKEEKEIDKQWERAMVKWNGNIAAYLQSLDLDKLRQEGKRHEAKDEARPDGNEKKTHREETT